jgi:predicted NBD/HSP70 family sugar kinase
MPATLSRFPPGVKQKPPVRRTITYVCRTNSGRVADVEPKASLSERGAALTGPGGVVSLIRSGDAVTRTDVARLTGLSRSTVAQRIETLVAHGLILEAGGTASTGGRPPNALTFNAAAGVVLVADLGATHSRIGICDLGGEVLGEEPVELAIADGPQAVLDRVHECFERLLAGAGRRREDVRGIGVGVPGPVEFATGQPISPPIMPGWDGFSIPTWFGERYAAPVLVDNDVNIMALGEHWRHWRDTRNLLFVKVGTGIGCGIVAGGSIHRGAQGAAGDIGHIRVAHDREVVCRCGNVNCLEAVAGGRAVAQALTAQGIEARDTRDVVALVRSGEAAAVQAVREAGRTLGEVLASAVNFYNPGVIVVGGDMGAAGDQLLAGVREVTIRRSPPLATHHLRIVPSRLGDRAGIIGAAIMVLEEVLSPAAIDRRLQVRAPA